MFCFISIFFSLNGRGTPRCCVVESCGFSRNKRLLGVCRVRTEVLFSNKPLKLRSTQPHCRRCMWCCSSGVMWLSWPLVSLIYSVPVLLTSARLVCTTYTYIYLRIPILCSNLADLAYWLLIEVMTERNFWYETSAVHSSLIDLSTAI